MGAIVAVMTLPALPGAAGGYGMTRIEALVRVATGNVVILTKARGALRTARTPLGRWRTASRNAP